MKEQVSNSTKKSLFYLQKFVYVFLFAMLVRLTSFGQTSVQNFGTGTASQTSQTGSTAIIPNPTSGTTWARGGVTAPAAPILVLNTSNPLGTTGSYVRGVASTSTSVSKFSPWVAYTGGTEFYTSFKVLFGDASAGSTAISGQWGFFQGAGAMYSDASNFSSAQVFTGLFFTYGAGGALTLTYRAGGTTVNTGLTQTSFSSATVYTVEIVGNNKTSGTINYTYNGNSQSVAVQKFDLYINGTKIGDDLAEASLLANTAIASGTFIGISSTSNVANIFVDDATTYNAVPAAIGVGATSATLANITQPTGSITQGTNDNVLSGFTVTSASTVDFTNVVVTATGSANGSDLNSFRIFRDNDGNGSINGADAAVSGTVTYSGTMTFPISGETGITSTRNYLIVANVAAVGTSTAGRTVTASIGSGNFTTTAVTNLGSATGNSRIIAAPVGIPAITVTGIPLSTFNTTTGTPSTSQKDTVSGTDLTDNISVKPPASFEVSLNNSTWIAFPDSIVLTPTLGVVSATPIYVRFNPTVSGTTTGSIINRSNGASAINVPVTGNSVGPISYLVTGSTYTQDFNGLPPSGSFSYTGQGSGPFYTFGSPVSASGTTGWQFLRVAGSTADAKFTVDDGGSNSGSAFSYGTGTATDRAFGALTSGANTSRIGAVIKNSTSDILTNVTISYAGEQWRYGGTAGVTNTLRFSYAVGASDISTNTVTAVPTLDFGSPITSGGTAAALNGNAPANRTQIPATSFVLNSNWMPGQNLVIYWDDIKPSGNANGIAVDDFSFSATAPSAPTQQDSTISFNNVSTFSLTAHWLKGNGTGRIVVMNTSNSFTNPTDGTSPTANANYISGQQVIYNGIGDSVHVTGLTAGTTYSFRVYAYNGSGASTRYSTASIAAPFDNPKSQATVSPVPPTQLIVTSVNGGITPFTNGSFYLVVQTLDGAGFPQNVIANTNLLVSILPGNGFGTPSGNLVGTLSAGTYIDTIFGINYTTEDFNVILTVSRTSGDVLTSGNTPPFNVSSLATQLTFQGVPASGIINSNVTSFTVQALKANNNLDVNYTGDITISIAVGPGGGNMLGTLTRTAVGGIATFNDIHFDLAGSYYLEADALDLTAASTGEIIITNVPTFTELVVPKYIGSKTSGSANSNRTPIAVCLQLDNLVPNTTYDLRAGLDTVNAPSTSYGVGNTWSGTAYGTATIQNVFTTDALGSSHPFWIYIEPTGNASRYGGGQVHNLRLGYVQDGGTLPLSPSFVGSKTITALDIQSSATTSTADDGAFLTGSAISCAAGKYILIYNNVAGTGDPLYSYQARQTTPSDTVTANLTSLPGPVKNIFQQNLSSNIGDWAAVIPTGVNNPNGVQRVEARNFDNTIFSSATDADGIWPGGANTTNVSRFGIRTLTLSDASLGTVTVVSTSSTPSSCPGTNDGTATVVATGNGLLTYSWNTSPVQTSATATGLAAGTYTVTVTDASGCSATASATVSQPATSTINADGPTTFCTGGSVTLSVAAGADNYLWASVPPGFSSSLSSVLITTGGSYTVTVTTGSCIQTSAPVVVTVNGFAYNGTIFSESMGTGISTTISGYSGWQNAAPVAFTSTTSTQSELKITNASPTGSGFSGGSNVFLGTGTNFNRDFIISGINTLGYTGLSLSFGLRRDNGAIDSSLTLEVSSDGSIYTPLTFTPTALINTWYLKTAAGTIPSTANLRIKFSKNNGCQYRLDDVKLTGTTSIVSIAANGSATFCSGGSVLLTSNVPTGITWSPGNETTQSILVTTSGTYTVTATANNGCTLTATSAPVTVVVNPTPTVVITDPAAVCSPNTVDITLATVTTGSTPGLVYTYWTDLLATIPFNTPTTAGTGTYYIKGTTGAGCSAVQSVHVTVNPTPAQPSITVTQPTCNSSTGTITVDSPIGAGITYSIDSINYVNTTGIFTTLTPGPYSVFAMNSFGCISPAAHVTVNPPPAPIVVSSFLPSSGSVGTPVIISGSNFTGATNVLFNGTSVTSFTVNNDNQITTSVPIGATTGLITVVKNTCSGVSGGIFTVINAATVNVKAYFEGYYHANWGRMDSTLFDILASINEIECDTVIVELHAANGFHPLVDSYKAIIHTNGQVTGTMSVASIGTAYYIAVRHRSAIWTWSANPVMLAAITNYDFTTSQSQAYLDNQILYGTAWCFYMGDMNQDENVALDDFSIWDADNTNFAFGYNSTDLNGDGNTALDDFSIWDANNSNFVFSAHPPLF